MKIAVISCLYANLPAFEAVLKDIEANHCEAIYSLGDLVGYSPYNGQLILKNIEY